MSRVGKAPIEIPTQVEVTVADNTVHVKGPQGELAQTVPAGITVQVQDGNVVVSRATEQRRHRALHGLIRTLIANMVQGVSAGFEKRLELQDRKSVV